MKGKLIVIDGLDGSGKSTQTEIIYNKLKALNEKVIMVSYPDYESNSSALVKMYLNGEFSDNADDVNAYAASSFYAVDRYASYMRNWRDKYNDGYTILASRYVSSNAIHQMAKLTKDKWDNYLEWLYDYEFVKMGIPKPDKIIFLDMPREVSDRLLLKRYNGDETKKDIHEKNLDYEMRCKNAAHYVAKKDGWSIIDCCKDGELKPLEAITEEILKNLE